MPCHLESFHCTRITLDFAEYMESGLRLGDRVSLEMNRVKESQIHLVLPRTVISDAVLSFS